jgi:hypothetical protein
MSPVRSVFGVLAELCRQKEHSSRRNAHRKFTEKWTIDLIQEIVSGYLLTRGNLPKLPLNMSPADVVISKTTLSINFLMIFLQ